MASINYVVTSNWGTGFVANVTVPGGVQGLHGWTIEFDASFDISNIWGAEIVSHLGDHYVIANADWNADVAAGSQATFGFQAATGTGDTSLSGLVLDGSGTTVPPPLPTLSIANASITEQNSGKPKLTFTVTLSQAASGPVTVHYATADGTATAGSDYAARSGTLSFAAGETSKTIQVPVFGDTVVEPDETLTVALSAPSGATIAQGKATGTILNDDVAAGGPTLSVLDGSVVEGNADKTSLTFTVKLSQASASAVTVQYATADGTASSASDYVAKTGTLTFAAGETSKTINVRVKGDTTAEGNETLTLRLSSPVGATIVRGTATGTIINDDGSTPPPLPGLSISDTSVIEGTPGGGAAAGWLSTSGNQIVDSAGHSVQIAGVNWFGFESSNLAPHGLWARGYKDMMNQMVSLGFNTIRLPFSSDMLHATAAPNGIDFSKNPDLVGLSALQIMDKIVDYAGQVGLKIILDHHRSDSGAGTSGNGLWYDGTHSQAQWIADWQMLAQRYADKPQVIGADLHNEPYNGTWGGGGANDWAAAATAAGNAIGAVNPNWLIFVEGVGTYQGQSYWWGGNLMGVKDRPIVLNQANKLVYSPHDYPNSVYPQTWFQSPDFPGNLPAKFDQMWGYIYRQNIAPVYLGEFGTNLTDPKDAPWLKAITAYLGGDFNNDGTKDIAAGQHGPSWTYWAWNPNSGDTGGILANDWNTVNQAKLDYLTPIEFDFDGSAIAPGSNAAVFQLTLSKAATSTVTVDFHTVPGDADSSDFTPTTGSVTFAPGELTKTISIPVTPDAAIEPNEHFIVVLTNAVGATLTDDTGTATIINDDPAPTTTASRMFSPYIDMAMPQDADLVAISQASGIENFTLAFMLASDQGIGWQGVGSITDDTLSNGSTILQQVQAIQTRGGTITISFGGAAGQEAALTAPDATTLQAEYQSVIDRYHIGSIDFDIEGAAELDQHSLNLRNQAIVGLEAANPGLKVSFTLPVLPTGLDASGLAVLQSAKNAGVRIDVVNVMTMDYGQSVDNNGQMGQNAISAAIATEKQVAALGLNAKVGVTPMIGVNDIASEVFTLADAQSLVDYAKTDPKLGLLAMWSVARDNGNSAGAHYASPDSSGVAQQPYQFAGILRQFDSQG